MRILLPFARRSLLILGIGVGPLQKPRDWVNFTWRGYNGEPLELCQSNTEAPLKRPCTPPQNAPLHREEAALGATSPPAGQILMRLTGEPLTYSDIAQIMRKGRARLGMRNAFNQHGLRYRSVMELAWAACDENKIANFSGHRTKAMIIP